MNVKEVVDTVLSLNGEKRIEPTCDHLIEGDWNQPVTGVATTFMATVDVIRRVIASGYNLIITHEPTYFTGLDRLEWLKDDPVYRRKKALINENGLSIWRYHDHMHSGDADLIYAGLMKDLGWEEYLIRGLPHPHCYEIPPVPMMELVEFLKNKLGLRTVRTVGRMDIECRRVGILVGGGSLGLGVEEMPAMLMQEQHLDVMVCGEITEWTLSAYIRDAADLQFNQAMIIIGHERSEYSGMKYLAELLHSRLEGVPVSFFEAGEPFTYL